MSDLLHWDYVNEFTAHEIACLIKGQDPHYVLPYLDQSIELIVDRIDRAYSDTLQHALFHGTDVLSEEVKEEWIAHKKLPTPQGFLASTELEKAYEQLISHSDEIGFQDFLSREYPTPKGIPKFKRATVAQWLTHNNLRSAYTFMAREPIPETNTYSQAKPLSTKERNTLLAIIATLCQEAKIDYTRPAKAAANIQHAADSMGISIGESTIESHLKKIPDALASRGK